MHMMLVARCLERIGDNAVDIGEQTAFVVTGLFREFSDSSHPAAHLRLSSSRARARAPWAAGAAARVQRLRGEAVADPEVGVDVAPARRQLVELLAQLADEDVDRAVAVRHRVAPHALVDLLARDHLAAGAGEQLSSSNSRRVKSPLVPRTKAWKRSGRISTSPTVTASARASRWNARARRTTASTRAITSSGWHGFVIQSSTPRRRPRTRWPTDVRPVQTTTPSAGVAHADLLELAPTRRRRRRRVDDEHVRAHGQQRLGRSRAADDVERRVHGLQALGQHLHEAACRVSTMAT